MPTKATISGRVKGVHSVDNDPDIGVWVHEFS